MRGGRVPDRPQRAAAGSETIAATARGRIVKAALMQLRGRNSAKEPPRPSKGKILLHVVSALHLG